MPINQHKLIMDKLLEFSRAQNTKNAAQEAYLQSGLGICYSLAVCRAVMRITGKLTWWEKAIQLITSWDGNVDSLDTLHQLPGNNIPISLRDLFNKILNYAVFNQADSEFYSYLELDQHTFLLPDGIFECMDQEDRVLTIKANFRASGHFSPKNLAATLNDPVTRQYIQSSICLIHTESHTCELGYDEGIWSYYNSKARYYFSNANVELLAKKITKNIGEDLTIEIASFTELEDAPFHYYYTELLNNQFINLMQGNGLFLIVDNSSSLLPFLIEKLKQSNYQNHDNQIDFEVKDSEGYTPLMRCVFKGDRKGIQALCEAGAALNDGAIILKYCIHTNDIETMQLLCHYGADLNQVYIKAMDTDKERNSTPFIKVVTSGNVNLADYLLKNYQINLALKIPLTLDILSAIVDDGMYKLDCDKYSEFLSNYSKNDEEINFTALHWAVFLENEIMLSVLLDAITDIPDHLQLLEELKTMAFALNFTSIYAMLDEKVVHTLQTLSNQSISRCTTNAGFFGANTKTYLNDLYPETQYLDDEMQVEDECEEMKIRQSWGSFPS